MTALLAEIEKNVCKLNLKEQQQLQSFLFNRFRNSETTEIDKDWLELSEKRYNDIISGMTKSLNRKDFIEKARSVL